MPTLRSVSRWPMVCLLGLTAAGCEPPPPPGPPPVVVKGKVLRNGQPFEGTDAANAPPGAPTLMVSLWPADGSGDEIGAEANGSTGTFVVRGRAGNGIPPGKYKVTVSVGYGKADQLGGKFDRENTPFVREVGPDKAEIVVDLDKPND